MLLSDWLDVKISWKTFLPGIAEILLNNSCSPALVRAAAYSAVARVAKAAVKLTVSKMRIYPVSINAKIKMIRFKSCDFMCLKIIDLLSRKLGFVTNQK